MHVGESNGGTDLTWFAIQSKPGQEALGSRCVSSLGVDTFLPQVLNRGSRGIRPVPKSLFSNYFFARFSPPLHLRAVRFSNGVCRVVGAREIPWPVGDEIIETIRQRVEEDGYVRLEERAWRSGDEVQVEEGPLRGWSGIFDSELDDGRRVVILLETLQCARVVLNRECLCPAA
jgi:transcription antitermination factor NusG